MEATDSQEDGEIVESERLTDTELVQFDENAIDSCAYRHPIRVVPALTSRSHNHSSPAETLDTYSVVPVLGNSVLKVAYTHMMGIFTIDNCQEFNCEL